MRTRALLCLVVAAPLAPAADIVDSMLGDRASFYYLDAARYPRHDARLPVGVFDSGTGGLTVLKEILALDHFDNRTRQRLPGGDGRKDFEGESFVFYGDQANMPYGQYPAENNAALLTEHIIKDVHFLLSSRYYPSPEAESFRADKRPVKAVVVACNTATALGMEAMRGFLRRAGLPLALVGVVDAGAKGALDTIGKDESASIGILATVGTVNSLGYVKAIEARARERGGGGSIAVFQQGSVGIAGAVDGMPEFISPAVSAPRADYRGPAAFQKIERYGFDFGGNCMLRAGATLQINSVENYIAYDTLELVEKVRRAPDARPLKTVVLACTHFPFYAEAFRRQLRRLYDYQEDGRYLYRRVLARDIAVVDPAVNTAEELHGRLAASGLFRDAPPETSEFYVSVPNPRNPEVKTDSQGFFTPEYKFGRHAGTGQETIRVVPFSRRSLPDGTIRRLADAMPQVFELIVRFNQARVPEPDRIAR